MESSQVVSWQFENFSTAELSPPTSPASPSSPLFYHDGRSPASPSSVKMASQQSQKPALSAAVNSRAQLASVVLNEIERLHSFDQQNDLTIHDEESIDLRMNLFDALADIEYTPLEDDTNLNTLAVPSPSVNTAETASDKLSAEFKSIVESLSAQSQPESACEAVTSFEDLIHITGIPTTTVVGDECLVPVEFIGRPSSDSGDLGSDEVESMDLDGIIISNDMAFINESDLFNLQEISEELIAEATMDATTSESSGENVLPYWAKDIIIPVDSLDTEMMKNDSTLNALLQGDVSTAQTFLQSEVSQSSFSSVSATDDVDPSVLEEAEVIEILEKPEPKKVERRGRKPNKKDSVTFIKDKALRKKEQNKTAATRYRQKKKQELACTLSVEDQLQATHDDLSQQRDKLSSELKVVRSLLRDMLQARKKRSSPSPPASRQPTASSIVQAQKLANRRK